MFWISSSGQPKAYRQLEGRVERRANRRLELAKIAAPLGLSVLLSAAVRATSQLLLVTDATYLITSFLAFDHVLDE